MNVRQAATVAAIRVASSMIGFGQKRFNWPEVSERVMEYAFAVKVMGGGSGRILEVGCVDAHNCLPTVLAALGYETHAIDIRDFKVEYPNLTFSRQNIMEVSYPDAFFDRVLAISVVEHIGLKGRYGVSAKASSGDRKAIDEMIRVLKPDGRLVITVPYGREYRVVDSVHRIYDSDHLSKQLFAGLKIRSEEYAVRDERKCWVLASKETAGRTEAKSGFGYAVAMFELSKT
jgi:SAM-dependent methyltransferase